MLNHRFRRGWLAVVLALLVATPAFAGELKDLKKDLRRALGEEDYSGALDVVKDIGALNDEKALDLLFSSGINISANEEFYTGLLQTIRGMDGYLDLMKEKADKGKWNEQALVCDILKGVESPEAVEVVLPLLEEKNHFVQISAVLTLEKSMQREAIGPLITLYEKLTKKKRRDVLYYQIADSLWLLTGQDFELIEDWWKWWEPIQNNFDPKETDTGGTTRVDKKRRGEDDADFIGVPIRSKNICFVLDTSGSMKYVHKDDIPGLARADGSDGGQGSGGGGTTPENQRLARFWTRMEMAKRALVMAVRGIKSSTLFNVVYFDAKAELYKKRAIKASGGGKKAVIKDLEDRVTRFFNDVQNRQDARRTTHTMDALVKAFNSDPKTNTIYFLSDGLPSKDGKTQDPTGPILDKVFDMNKFRKIKIHTFGFYPRTQGGQPMPGLEEAKKWLKKLAERTGGTYTDLKVDTRFTPDKPYGPGKKTERGIVEGATR